MSARHEDPGIARRNLAQSLGIVPTVDRTQYRHRGWTASRAFSNRSRGIVAATVACGVALLIELPAAFPASAHVQAHCVRGTDNDTCKSIYVPTGEGGRPFQFVWGGDPRRRVALAPSSIEISRITWGRWSDRRVVGRGIVYFAGWATSERVKFVFNKPFGTGYVWMGGFKTKEIRVRFRNERWKTTWVGPSWPRGWR